MATTEETEALMLAYVYGELSASDARDFERRMGADAELRAEVEGMRAVHDLFGRDQEYGQRSLVDAPPPHLVDAICRAEALARPPQVREAMVKRAAPSSTWTARMARWLLGGGLVVGAAAAFLFVVTRSADKAEMAMAPAPVVAAADVPRVAKDSKPMGGAPAPETVARAGAEQGREGGAVDRSAAANEAPPATGGFFAGEKADQKGDVALETESRAAKTAGHLDSAADDANDGVVEDLEGMRLAEKQDKASSSSASARRADGPARARTQAHASPALRDAPAEMPDEAKEEATAKKAPRRAPEAKAKDVASPELDSLSGASSNGYDYKVGAGGAAAEPMPSSAMAPPAAPPPPPAKVAEAAKPAAQSAPAGVVSSDEIARKRNAVLQKRLERAETSPRAAQADREKRLEQANLTLASAQRELARKDYVAAYDLMTRAEHIDIDGALGAEPQTGEMKALLGLKRPADAAAIARRALGRSVKVGGIADAWLIGVQAAQQIGDTTLERDLWTRLLKVPAHRREARRALRHLSAPAVREKADFDDEVVAPATTAAPRAAAPPADASKR